jgi:hypothetical protein
MTLSLADRFGDPADHRYVHQAIGGICRGFHENHREPALTHGLLRNRADLGLIDAVGKTDRANGQTCECFG